MDRASLAKALGIPPFALNKYQAQCRKFTAAQLREAVEDCVQSEENVKTGRMGDQISVELLILKYSSL
jgi:DNA polymerase-3 subunit delta